MKLDVGMWVITKDRMKVGQIKDFCTCGMCEKRGFYEPIITNNIYITNYDKSQGFHGYKFYNNILELIQVGDYVNDERVKYNTFNVGGNIVLTDSDKAYTESEIENIVTKERFNSVKYIVG